MNSHEEMTVQIKNDNREGKKYIYYHHCGRIREHKTGFYKDLH